MKTKENVEQGKGTADHLMPLGYLFYLKVFFGWDMAYISNMVQIYNQ